MESKNCEYDWEGGYKDNYRDAFLYSRLTRIISCLAWIFERVLPVPPDIQTQAKERPLRDVFEQ